MTFDEPSAVPLISRGQQRSARRLLSRRERDEQGLFLAEGAQAVREALRRPDLVEDVTILLFKQLPKLERRDVDMATPGGQDRQRLTPEQDSIDLP